MLPVCRSAKPFHDRIDINRSMCIYIYIYIRTHTHVQRHTGIPVNPKEQNIKVSAVHISILLMSIYTYIQMYARNGLHARIAHIHRAPRAVLDVVNIERAASLRSFASTLQFPE